MTTKDSGKNEKEDKLGSAPVGYHRLSPGVYRDSNKKIIKFNPAKVISKRPGTVSGKAPGLKKGLKKVDVSIRQGDADQQIVYGRFKVGGIYSFAHLDNRSTSNPVLPLGQEVLDVLHLVITIAGHEIGGLERVFVDGEEAWFPGSATQNIGREWAIKKPGGTKRQEYLENHLFAGVNLGGESQTTQPDLQNQSEIYFPGLWTADHRQRGCAHIYHILTYSEKAFPQGIPDFQYLIKGKKILDTRTGLRTFSSNAALVIADYLTDTKHGVGASIYDIDAQGLFDAANVCDEIITGPGGYTGARYSINGIFNSGDDHESILKDMSAAMGGDVIYQGGKWRILPGKYRNPSGDIVEDDFRGPITIQTHAARDQSYNKIKATFIDPTNFEPGEIVATESLYLQEDGSEKVETISLSAVTTGIQAHLLAFLELQRVRQGIQIQARFSLATYRFQVGDVVNVKFLKYGWNFKTFEVRRADLVYSSDEGLLTELTLTETSPLVYEWRWGQELNLDRAPNTNLPNPYFAYPPTNLVLSSGTTDLFIAGDGTIISRLAVSWDAPNSDFGDGGGRFELQYKKSSDSVFLLQQILPGYIEQFHITDVLDGERYDVRVRCLNSLAVPSTWISVTNHLVTGKSAPPADVTGFNIRVDEYGIVLYWDPVRDLDLSYYELREGPTLEDSTLVTEIRGTSFRHTARLVGTFTFFLYAVDTSGNKSAEAAFVSFVLPRPAAPVLSYVIDGADLVLSWQIPRSQFQIDSYIVRTGGTGVNWDGAVYKQETKGTSVRGPINWVGSIRFLVAARDIYGNLGDASSVDVQITGPGAVNNLSADTIDNNVLLRWGPSSSGTLPIEKYLIYRGASYPVSAQLVGEVGGTFISLFEFVSGVYRYWVIPLDVAGNRGPERGVLASVAEPPDFELKTAGILDPEKALTLENIYLMGVGFTTTPVQSNNAGQPVGLLLGITTSGLVAPTNPLIGQPMGLLMGLTYSGAAAPTTPSASGLLGGL